MRIILRLAFLFMAASILNANAGQIGPPEGGPCDGCSVWIDSTTLDGGQINSSLRSSMLDGSRSYAPETEALAHANCSLRGLSGPTLLSQPWRLRDFWVDRQAQTFTCSKADIFMESQSSTGGEISTTRRVDFDVKNLAGQACLKQNLPVAIVDEPSWESGQRFIYKYKCGQYEPAKANVATPGSIVNSQPVTNSEKLSITKAKEECSKLYPPKSEKLPKCVMELIK